MDANSMTAQAVAKAGLRTGGQKRPSPATVGEPTRRVWKNIRDLGLEGNIAELDTWGLTIVPPDKAAPAGFVDRLREAVLREIEKREGRRPDFETGETHRNNIYGSLHYLVLQDPVFQEMLCQPAALALVDHLLGEGSILHANSAQCKGPHDAPAEGGDLILALHSDNQLLPSPFRSFAEFANITWALTDYSKEGGALAFVPGSHLLCRHPLAGEGVDAAVPVECPAGSIICWHGNTWHGAYRRTKPGIRLNLANGFSRAYLWPRHPLREDVTQEILDRNPPRFAKICGRHLMTNWREEGPDMMNPNYQKAFPTLHS